MYTPTSETEFIASIHLNGSKSITICALYNCSIVKGTYICVFTHHTASIVQLMLYSYYVRICLNAVLLVSK